MFHEISLNDDLHYGIGPAEEMVLGLFYSNDEDEPLRAERFYWELLANNNYAVKHIDNYNSHHQGISGSAVAFMSVPDAVAWCQQYGLWQELAMLFRLIDPRWLDLRMKPHSAIGLECWGNSTVRKELLLPGC